MKKLILTCPRALAIFFALIVMLCGCRDESQAANKEDKKKEPTPEELIASAKNGNASSMAEILTRIEAGESFPIDRETAFTMLKQASDNQDPVAQFHFGEMLINGTSSSPKNVEGGIELLKKAADSENPDALLFLGQIHLHGLNGRFRNTKFGLEYLKKAIVKGNKDAQREMGAWNAFYSQEDNSQEAAIGFLEPIAEGGDVLAQRYMGYMRRKIEASGKNQTGSNFEAGSRDEGLKQTQSKNELKTSEDWFKLAAENGDAPSMYALGELYMDNDYKDVSANARIETAINWYLKAAENGDQDACNELAEIYSGNEFKLVSTGSAFYELPEAERSRFINLEKAIKFYEKSIELGDLYSFDNLANIYLNRDHSVFFDSQKPKNNLYNPTKAKDILAEGYKNRSSYAGFYLAQFYETGNIVEKDIDTSFRIQVESYIDFRHPLFLNSIEGMEYRRKDNGRFIKRLQQIADGGHAASKYALASIFLNDTLAGRAISAKASSDEEYWLITRERFSTYNGKREADPTPQNIPLAVSQLNSASELGHAASQVELGILYETGNGVEKNLNEAYRLYSNGLELGNFEANYFLGELYSNKDFDKRNPLKAIEYLEEYAQSNPAVAGLTIGAIYLEGKDVPQDTEMALHWFKTAANAKDGKAAYLVHTIYRDGDGIDENRQAADMWLEMAAENGFPFAIKKVADKYYYGNDGPKNPKKAFEFYKILAEAGNAEAQNQLAIMYSTGIGVNKDSAQYFKWLKMAAEQNHIKATYYLGNAYYSGHGVAIDKKLALQWYKKASDLGAIDGDDMLAVIYYNGLGVPVDYDLAFQYAKKAAEQGKPRAQNHLGVCYENGYGVKKDPKLARTWFEKAITNGDKYARGNLINLLTKPATENEGLKPDYKYALELLEEDSDKNASDYVNIGWLYSKINPPNYEKMIEYYEKAALMGEANGISNLAFSYLNGDGVVKNYAEALAFFYLAQAVGNNKNKKLINALETSLPPNSIQVAQNKAQAIHEQIKKNKKTAVSKEEKSQDKDKDKQMPEQAGASGSGVLISSKGIIVTAFHVIENGNKILVRTSKGDYPAKVVSGDRKNDLALLQLEGMNTPLKVAPIAGSSSVKLGETVFTLGFPNIGVQGFNLKMTKGEISSTTGIQDDPRQFQISVPVQPGNSGGPLFDSKGNVVGIVVAKLNATMMVEHTGDLPQNVNYAVKSAYLLPLLEEYRSEMPSSKDESDSEKMEEVVSEVRDACVMILVE